MWGIHVYTISMYLCKVLIIFMSIFLSLASLVLGSPEWCTLSNCTWTFYSSWPLLHFCLQFSCTICTIGRQSVPSAYSIACRYNSLYHCIILVSYITLEPFVCVLYLHHFTLEPSRSSRSTPIIPTIPAAITTTKSSTTKIKFLMDESPLSQDEWLMLLLKSEDVQENCPIAFSMMTESSTHCT